MKEINAKYWTIFYYVVFLGSALVIGFVAEQNNLQIIALFDLMIISGVMGISYFITLHLNRNNQNKPNSKKS